MASKTAENAVREYLTALRDPDSLKDEKKLKDVEDKIASTKDVLEEAKLLSELNRLSKIDPLDYEAGFVEHGKAWADEANVPAKTLSSMGVGDDVLRKAGFDVASGPSRSPKPATRRVSRDDVVDVVLGQGEAFVLNHIESLTGASLATVRKVVASLVEDGRVIEKGDDPSHSGRGRAPKVYEVKS